MFIDRTLCVIISLILFYVCSIFDNKVIEYTNESIIEYINVMKD